MNVGRWVSTVENYRIEAHFAGVFLQVLRANN